MRRSDPELAAEALEHLSALRRHLARGDLDEGIVADAVSFRLSAAIDAVGSGSEELRTRVFGDEWPLAHGLRNRIVHAYGEVDLDVVRATVERDLPAIERRLVQERPES